MFTLQPRNHPMIPEPAEAALAIIHEIVARLAAKGLLDTSDLKAIDNASLPMLPEAAKESPATRANRSSAKP